MTRLRPLGPFGPPGRLAAPLRRALRLLRAGLAVAGSAVPPALLAATWATHVVACVAGQLWGLLLLGAALYPVTVVHGLAVWLVALL